MTVHIPGKSDHRGPLVVAVDQVGFTIRGVALGKTVVVAGLREAGRRRASLRCPLANSCPLRRTQGTPGSVGPATGLVVPGVRPCAPAGRGTRPATTYPATGCGSAGCSDGSACSVRSGEAVPAAASPHAGQPPVHRPNRLTRVGTSRHRTIVASTRIPAPRPVARTLMSVRARWTWTGTRGTGSARRWSPAGRCGRCPSMTASSVLSPVVVFLAHAGQEEHLVVHGQSEQEREDHQRYPHRDRAGGRACPTWPCCRARAARPARGRRTPRRARSG